MNAIIIDDESDARGVLRELLHLFCPQVQVVAEADNLASGIRAIWETPPDVIFLDVQLGENTGFDLLAAFPRAPFKTVFITGYDQFALQAFRVHAVDYLLKPVAPSELVQAVEKAMQLEQGAQIDNLVQSVQGLSVPARMAVPIRNGMIFITLSDIVRLEGDGNYTQFHLNNGESMLASRHLKAFEEMLPSPPFFRVHQSHLIHLDAMKQLLSEEGGTYIQMLNGDRIPVARRMKDSLLETVRRHYTLSSG